MHLKISDLIQSVRTLRFYEAQLSEAQGANFNIFELLRVGRSEVGTHNPYLAEFLDPKGRHGLGDRPLAAFVRRFRLTLDPATTSVYQERHLGGVTDDSGGRIDILLSDKQNCHVAIESKIDAADQKNQLHRYQKEFPTAQIVYLTLDGREPSEFTTRDTEGVKTLSYAHDILAWQEDCHREASGAPIVRETIAQYITLLKRITHQSTNTRMSEQIVQTVLKDEASLGAYFELVRSENAVRAKIIAALKNQCDEIAKALGLEARVHPDLAARFGSFEFSDASMREQSIRISFQFQTANYRGLNFGICYFDQTKHDKAPSGSIIAETFRQSFGRGEPALPWWPVKADWTSRSDWADGTFADIFFGRFQSELKDKVEKLLKVVRTAEALRAS